VIVPKSNVAKALARSLPVIGAGITGYEILSDIWEQARVREGPGDTILMDPGQGQETINGWKGTSNSIGSPYNVPSKRCDAVSPSAVVSCLNGHVSGGTSARRLPALNFALSMCSR